MKDYYKLCIVLYIFNIYSSIYDSQNEKVFFLNLVSSSIVPERNLRSRHFIVLYTLIPDKSFRF